MLIKSTMSGRIQEREQDVRQVLILVHRSDW